MYHQISEVRMSEHYNGAAYSNYRNLCNVSKHFKYVHAGNMESFVFSGVERVNFPGEVISTLVYLGERSGGYLLLVLEPLQVLTPGGIWICF